MRIESNEDPIDPSFIAVARQLSEMAPSLPVDMRPRGFRVDSAESISSSARQLVHVVTTTYKQEFADLIGVDLLPPPSQRASLGMTQFTWREQEVRGKALITPVPVNDGPNVDIAVEEAPLQRFAWIQTMYGWTIPELWAAQETGIPLEKERGEAAKQIIAHAHDNIILLGDGTQVYGGLRGLFTMNGTLTYTIDTGSTSGATLWASKNGDEVYRDLLNWFHYVRNQTSTVEKPNTTVLPENKFQVAIEKRMGGGGDVSQMNPIQFFKKTIKETYGIDYDVLPAIKLNGLGAGGTGRAVVYHAGDESRVQRNDVTEFMQLTPQVMGMGVQINCLAKTGGAVAKRKKSICIVDGL